MPVFRARAQVGAGSKGLHEEDLTRRRIGGLVLAKAVIEFFSLTASFVGRWGAVRAGTVVGGIA